MNFSTNKLTCGGFSAQIMEADRLVGDSVFGLPPGSPLNAYRVKQFNQHPDHWIDDDDGSWVVVVKPNKGLWFDWRGNDQFNTAVLPSVKGCNPITGIETKGFGLDQYIGGSSTCPKHPHIKLNGNRHCSECGYSIPAQNYVSAPNTLWWDGFRNDDGTVRQFFFTEDEMRDVATHLIGEANVVPAFGFAFYKKKPEYVVAPRRQEIRSKGGSFGSASKMSKCFNDVAISNGGMTLGGDNHAWECFTTNHADGLYTAVSYSAPVSMSIRKVDKTQYRDRGMDCMMMSFCDDSDQSYSDVIATKAVAVGAGAKIDQKLSPDTEDISHWKESPDAVMRIYFVFEEEFAKWRKYGMKCLEDVEQSMLKGLPVG